MALHKAKDALFHVQGPMGKPLSISWQNKNVAFAAGTGVLVFMDLVAYLLKSVCLNKNKQSV